METVAPLPHAGEGHRPRSSRDAASDCSAVASRPIAVLSHQTGGSLEISPLSEADSLQLLLLFSSFTLPPVAVTAAICVHLGVCIRSPFRNLQCRPRLGFLAAAFCVLTVFATTCFPTAFFARGEIYFGADRVPGFTVLDLSAVDLLAVFLDRADAFDARLREASVALAGFVDRPFGLARFVKSIPMMRTSSTCPNVFDTESQWRCRALTRASMQSMLYVVSCGTWVSRPVRRFRV